MIHDSFHRYSKLPPPKPHSPFMIEGLKRNNFYPTNGQSDLLNLFLSQKDKDVIHNPTAFDNTDCVTENFPCRLEITYKCKGIRINFAMCSFLRTHLTKISAIFLI